MSESPPSPSFRCSASGREFETEWTNAAETKGGDGFVGLGLVFCRVNECWFCDGGGEGRRVEAVGKEYVYVCVCVFL